MVRHPYLQLSGTESKPLSDRERIGTFHPDDLRQGLHRRRKTTKNTRTRRTQSVVHPKERITESHDPPAERMHYYANTYSEPHPLQKRALDQCARELLLAQSSDWLFIITNGTMVDYAKKRIKDHIGRFTKLYEQIKEDKIDRDFLKSLKEKDCIFPEIDFKIYY